MPSPGPGGGDPATRPATEPADQPRPDLPQPQQPAPANERSTDLGKPIAEWQHATDDWFGLRPRLEDAGVTVTGRLAMDYSKVFNGGRSPGGAAFRDLLNLGVTADAGKLFGLKGGTFFANFQNEAGDDGSRDVGDLQRFSNVDADGRTQLSEVWYEQSLFEDRLKVRVGKIDPNALFAAPTNAAEFLNSSMGFDPTIVLPHYPDPAFGLQLLYAPGEHFSIGGGVFDGSGQEGVLTGSYGPAHLFGPPSDLVFFVEGGPRWNTGPGELAGRLALGAWHHTGTFDRLRAGGTQDGATGCYAIADQLLWRANPKDDKDPRGLAGFFQYGYADPRVMLFAQHVGAGVQWTGALPGRDSDVLGFGATYVRFAAGAGLREPEELAVELFYKVQLTPFLSIKPDLQYIKDPGGTYRDALVGTVRIQIEF